MVSSLQLLRGQVYESRDTEAVRTDLTCVEAMTSHQMLTLEKEILASQTQPRTELSQLAGDIFIYVYGSSLKKYSEVKLTSLPLSLDCEMICSCSVRCQQYFRADLDGDSPELKS